MNTKKYKGFSGIGQILPHTAKTYKLEHAMHRYQALSHWEKALLGFLPEGQGKTKAMDLQQGILVVACLCKEVAYQIKLLARKIITALNELVGRVIVYSLKIEV